MVYTPPAVPSSMTAPSHAQRRRGLVASVVEGALHAVMVGVSESYLGALAVELGHGDVAIALLVTLPILVGALAQLTAGRLGDRIGRRRLVLIGAALQAASHVGFWWIASTREDDFLALLLAKVAFWTSGMMIVPAWSAWMARLTEGMGRERYFARRGATTAAALLVTFLFAGFFLESGRRAGDALGAFAVMFVVGLVARAVSLGGFFLMPPMERLDTSAQPSLRAVIARSRLRTPVYLAAMTFGTYLSAPFFTPYMLRVLELDFERYAALIATATLTKVVAFPLLHRAAVRFGLPRVLLVSGIGVAVVPLAWSWTTEFGWLMAAQVLSGAAWSGVELASFQLLLDSADDDHRTGLMGLSSAMSGAMQVTAALVGSALLVTLVHDYVLVFVISAAARALALAFLWSAVRRESFERIPRVFVRIVSMRPVEGVVRKLVGWESPRD